MTPEQFAYWMQGFCELSPVPPTPEQWKSIREHLDLVFNKVTPQVDHKTRPVNPPGPPSPSLRDILEQHMHRDGSTPRQPIWNPWGTEHHPAFQPTIIC